MKVLSVVTATTFLCLLNSEAKPLTLDDVELFAITPDEAVKRLEIVVKPHQKRVDDAIAQIKKEKLNLDELIDYVRNNYTDVQNKLKTKIEGYLKAVEDQKPPEGKCVDEKKDAAKVIEDVNAELTEVIKKKLDDYEKQNQKVSPLYEQNSGEYEIAKTTIYKLVGQCGNQFQEVHLIIACVGIGVQGFNIGFAKIDVKKWKELNTETHTTANKAIDDLKKSLDDNNFSKVTDAIKKIENCISGKPDEKPEDGNQNKPEEGSQGNPEEGNQGKPEDGNQGKPEEENQGKSDDGDPKSNRR